MTDGPSRKQIKAGRLPHLAAAISSALVLGACAQGAGSDLLGMSSLTQEIAPPNLEDPVQAVTHFGRRYATTPRDKDIALNFAKALTETGQKSRALAVLRAASAHHGRDPEFASVYGRAALASGQLKLATQLLANADNPDKPDWRTVSARGAALAQSGKFKEATTQFERARQLAPGNPSVMNNLAMAKAATGDLPGAEVLLRQASLMPVINKKVKQNLALVLRLQGRDSEAANVRSGSQNLLRKAVTPAAASNSAKQKVAHATKRTKTK